MSTTQPLMIGIAGCSGAGKTCLATRLAGLLGGEVLSLDHYYADLAHLPLSQRERTNFDHPDSLDWVLAESQLEALSRGEAIDQPRYDFPSHTRESRTVRAEPSPVMVVDGIFALYSERIRRLYTIAIFVDLEETVCLERRLARDVMERGRTPESVLRQYQETVSPMAKQFVLPTRQFADVIVRGCDPLEESVRKVLGGSRVAWGGWWDSNPRHPEPQSGATTD